MRPLTSSLAADGGVAVGRLGGTTSHYVFTRSQPALPAVSHPRAGHSSGVLTLELGKTLRVAGTGMVLAAGRDPQGQVSLAAVLMAGSSLVQGSYEVGVNAHKVMVLRLHGSLFSPVFSAAEPRKAPVPTTATTPTTRRTTATSRPTTTTTRPAAPTTTAPTSEGGPVGSSAALGGVRLKLVSISNDVAPATPYDSLPAGEQFDTATVQVTNVGSVDYQATSNGSTAMVGTDGKVYWPDTAYKAAGCTDFGSGGATGAMDIPSGASQPGCVHFRVPSGVHVKYVYYSPDAGWTKGDYITWYP